MLTRFVVCGLMALARLIELAWSRHNIQSIQDTREGAVSRRTYPLIVALHTATIVGTLFLGKSQPRMGWLILLLSLQPLRCWTLATLGTRWNARGAVPVAMDVATSGPYRFVRHPNYSIVALELLSLPAACGLYRFAIGISIVNATLLTLRIRDEEALLLDHPAYQEHFADKPRFIPFLF